MTKQKIISYENDLYPGEVIGGSALGGINKRLLSVLSISPCQLLMIGVEDFKMAEELAGRPVLSLNDKFVFLKNVPLFRSYLDYSLYCIANAMEVQIIAKDVLVCRKNRESSMFAFVYNGKLDIMSDLEVKSPLASLQKHDYFGESSILRQKLVNGSSGTGTGKKEKGQKDKNLETRHKSSYHFRECFEIKTASSLEVLVLPSAYFYLVEAKSTQVPPR